jgi:hypothetical protein
VFDWMTRRRWISQLGALFGIAVTRPIAGVLPAAAQPPLGGSDPSRIVPQEGTGATAGARGPAMAPVPGPAPADGEVSRLTSTSEVTIPPRGSSFFKFSFDFPEPSVAIGGLRVGFMVFTYENAYGLDADALRVESRGGDVLVSCDRLVWAGGQQRAEGRFSARLSGTPDRVTWTADVEMGQPIRAVTCVVRGVPRGELSPSGQTFFDPKDDEVMLAYPFSGGDLFGPGSSGGMTTPQLFVRAPGGETWSVSSRDTAVRTKRFYLQPGPGGYRMELVHETEGWKPATKVSVPEWRVERGQHVMAYARSHYDFLAQTHHIQPWDTRPDVPGWMRRTAIVLTLHGMHYTGYVFNDYARMLEIVRWVCERMPGERVLAFLSSWDGRYYWDYPLYQPDERMGGDAGFRRLVEGAHAVGAKVMPMFGANSANRKQPAYQRLADAATHKPDGDRFDLDWVDWDNDRHQDGWLSYMNLGVPSWRTHLADRISDIVGTYGVDAYFLDIVGGWVNNDKADMHEGTRLLVEDLRRRHPQTAVVGEMHYDALLGFIPMYHSFSPREIAPVVQRYSRYFQHLSHPAPGRGSSGVHEYGFGRFDPVTLSLNAFALPTLNVVDDTFDRHKAEMEAVIRRARERAGI